METIKSERIKAVEPITAIVGKTEEDVYLIEDRNGIRYALDASLLKAD